MEGGERERKEIGENKHWITEWKANEVEYNEEAVEEGVGKRGTRRGEREATR